MNMMEYLQMMTEAVVGTLAVTKKYLETFFFVAAQSKMNMTDVMLIER